MDLFSTHHLQSPYGHCWSYWNVCHRGKIGGKNISIHDYEQGRSSLLTYSLCCQALQVETHPCTDQRSWWAFIYLLGDGGSTTEGNGDCDGSNQKPERAAYNEERRRAMVTARSGGLNKFLQEEEWRCHLVLMHQQRIFKKGTCRWDLIRSGTRQQLSCHQFTTTHNPFPGKSGDC